MADIVGQVAETVREQPLTVVGSTVALYGIYFMYNRIVNSVDVPSYGRDVPILYWLDAFKFFKDGRNIILDGYQKYPIFKVPVFGHWNIVVRGKYAEELGKAPDDVLGFMEAANDSLQANYTLGRPVANDPWHIETIRNTLIKNLTFLFKDIWEETEASMEDEFDLSGYEWKKVVIAQTIPRIISRVSNRAFVGLPLCRDPVWRDLNVQFTIDVVKDGMMINMFPTFLRPLAGRYLTKLPENLALGMKFIVPIIQEREKLPSEERPVDMITWLMEQAPDYEKKDYKALTNRIIGINFAAIHTTSMTFTQSMYQLIAHPECIEVLRDEAQDVVGKHGWTKSSMGMLRKLDSFLRETQRYSGFSNLSMTRKVLKPFTFSNGVRVPKGAHVSVASHPVHWDESIYNDAHEFKPWRYIDIRSAADDPRESAKQQMVATSMNYLLFGHGKHACPGRFFAVNELKCLIAHFILTYDVKWADPNLPAGYEPPPFIAGGSASPNSTAEIMIRRRK